MDSNANIELLRGHMDTIILCTLLPGDKYGLEILKEIVDSSQELYTLKQPTLYSALKRLTADGFVNSYEGDVSNGRKRVYYSLTEKGRKFVTQDQLQWEFSRTIIDKLISDKVFDPVLNEKPFDPSEFRPSTKRTKSKSEEDIEISDQQYNNNTTFDNTSNNDALPIGVTSGAINSSFYNNDTVIKQTEQPIKVASSDKVDSKFLFTSEISPELRRQEIESRIKYRDTPASLDSLYDTKWDKPTFEEKKQEQQPETVNKQYSCNIDTTILNNHEIDDIDRKTATSMLYSNDYDSKPTVTKSKLPESLTHYDLDIKPKSDNLNTSSEKAYVEHEKPKYIEKRLDATDNILPTHISPDEKSVNYISTLGDIFNSNSSNFKPPVTDTKKDLYSYDQNIAIPQDVAPKKKPSNIGYIEDMNLSKLKSKLYEEDITLKQYVKSETSSYYVNKYYYSNKILRDWSYIAYGLFALFCIVCYCSTLKLPNKSLGAFLGIMFVGAVLPIFTTVKWYMNKSARKATNFSFAHTLVTGAIIMLIALMAILAVSFFIVKINVADVKTMINPLILPLVSLIMIPLDITFFSLLYDSKKYHLR